PEVKPEVPYRVLRLVLLQSNVRLVLEGQRIAPRLSPVQQMYAATNDHRGDQHNAQQLAIQSASRRLRLQRVAPRWLRCERSSHGLSPPHSKLSRAVQYVSAVTNVVEKTLGNSSHNRGSD